MYTLINGIPVFGDPLQNAVDQMANCMKHDAVHGAALMADHHLGYAVPVGGVIAYHDHISPSGVGYDIGCGNKAVLLDVHVEDIIHRMSQIMDDVASQISFGVGHVNKSKIDHELFERDIWDNISILKEHKAMAHSQLGTVGSGNHYVDIFADELDRVWVGVHFGSRGLGHKVASHYIKAGGGKDGIFVDPVVLDAKSELGYEYIQAMQLAGDYAYAGRDWVCQKVADIIGANIVGSVHNHHNFAWQEHHGNDLLWVVRKGATPAFCGQRGFVGGTMGENSVILEGTGGLDLDATQKSYYSTVHGAGRVMSRTEAAGKTKYIKGVKTKISEGKVTQEMMDEWVQRARIELRGAGRDESPHCYKRLDEVLDAQGKTVRVTHTLRPLGVAMAGADVFDPYKD